MRSLKALRAARAASGLGSVVRRAEGGGGGPSRAAKGDRLRRACFEALEDRRLFTAAYALIGDAGTTLIKFDTTNPSLVQNAVTVEGLQTGETLRGIDFRPTTGVLYGLGVADSGPGTDVARLYTINPDTGAATQLGTPIGGLADNDRYGFDFNPAADRIRVTNGADQSFRLNPNDGTLAGADTNLSDGNPGTLETVVAAAYDRNDKDPATPTTLFGIDFSGDELVRIGGVDGSPSPNGGVVTPVGPTGVTSTNTDINFDTSPDGTALATMRAASTTLTGLYTINLATGAATLVATVGNGADDLKGFAVNVDAVANAPDATNDAYTTTRNVPLSVAAPGVLGNDTDPNGDALTVGSFTQPANGSVTVNPNGSFTYTPNAGFFGTDTFTYRASDGALQSAAATVTITVAPANLLAYGVVGASTLVKFLINSPNDIVDTVPVQGLQPGERLLGIDVRPANGQLYGLGSSGRVYTINGNTGATTGVVLTADPTDASVPFAGLAGTSFGVDFNPVPDRLRVTANSRQNLRINVDTGAVITDGDLNPLNPAVVGAGYLNPVGGATSTTLFTVDRDTNALNVQAPPNDGTQVPVGSLGVDVTGDLGFDVLQDGRGFLAATAAADNVTRLYRVNLSTGAATPVGPVGNGAQPLEGLAVALENRTPTAVPDAYTATRDTTLSVPPAGVLANDTDPEGNGIIAVLIGLASNGTVTLNPNGAFSYSPNAGFTGTDTFTYRVSDGVNQSNVATVTITVNPPSPPPPPATTVSVNDVTLTEGNAGTKSFVFTVALNAPSASTVSVQYSTANATAQRPVDYQLKSGSLTFTPGQTSKTVTVLVNGDTTIEGNEFFNLNLFSPVNAALGDGSGRGTIVNDDRPAASAVAGSSALSEGNSGLKAFTFKVRLNRPSIFNVSVNYATSNGSAAAGSDYNAASGTVTFAAGQTEKVVTVNVRGDTAGEGNETFLFNISNPINAGIADAVEQGTILNDD